ncbi:PREDICTED: tumor necrosis factor receptor superfamily member 10A-like [Thamnophis sirtalis]|uniref:Tumor necrosis factor receptor superfamily member 10A-like n=1 Tax=Thamnophis sirtalis TaxID=35019 RepID=A0A6I9Y2L0_9SAUR|nr:PREDICTED: tumor necrosis factor receptor superfamily member 10A-like [Thamnophis sirtalis]
MCWKKNTNFRNACRGFWSSKRTQFLQYLQKRSSPEPREVRDNMSNNQREESQILSPSCSTANGQALEIRIPLRDSPPEEEGREYAEMRTLVPVNCRNSAEALRQSFDVFVSKVPQKYWKRFMRLLQLTENEIDCAERSSHYMYDQHYQMLRTWLDKNGQVATLSILLEVLSGMDLKGIVEEVKSAVIAQGLYVYEE